MENTVLLVMDIQQGIVQRFAGDPGYLERLQQAVFDADPEVHRVLTEKVFPRQAEVLTVERWTAQLASA